ncbi:MAG TPA: L-threonylcarbamoyladenylate synthase [Candidatus Saccharimonadales bacterium]|nr:L-threonylcarbamoyladenylate synthase [Candidatus Saccharimonadales bacterium]
MKSSVYKILQITDPELIQILRAGGIAVIPTDTVYGVCVAAQDKMAVERLYRLKKRESKPGTIVASSIDKLVELGIKRRYLKAVEQYWPGPISIEIPHGLDYLSQSTGRQAFRVVAEPSLIKLLEKTGPLLTSSANQPGEKPAVNIDEAIEYFGKDVDAYIDGGDLSERKSSTLIRVVDDAVEVIREGSVKIDESGRIIDEA